MNQYFKWGSRSAKTSQETSDLKSFDIYAQDISSEIMENFGKENDGYIFAISAKWGAGKTKLLNLMRPHLTENGYTVVTYNAWQYAQDSDTLRRTFLKNLNKQLHSNTFLYWLRGRERQLARLDYDQTRNSLPAPTPSTLLVLFGVALIAILISIYFGFRPFEIFIGSLNSIYALSKSNPALTAALTIVLAALALPKLLQIEKKSTRITSTDEFEKLFDKLTRERGKLVIFIDDLDRCTPEGAKLVLDALKTFFQKRDVAYVVTGDHTVLERYMGEMMKISPVYDKDGNVDSKSTDIARRLEGQRFMQKIFSVYWKLPSLEPSEKEYLIDKNLKDNPYLSDTDRPIIKALLITYLDRTPREIKRFTSLFHFSLKIIHTRLAKLADETNDQSKQLASNLKELKQRPAYLAKILLLQEKFAGPFDYFSEFPAKYSELEKRILTHANKNPSDDSKWESLLANDDQVKFIDFIRTPPTFHNLGATMLITSPDLFFYYSGFAGANSSGIISEDFLSRYIVPDESLVADFTATAPKQNRDAMLKAGISHLEQIQDNAQLAQAINNLIQLFEIDELGHQVQVIDLVESLNFERNWVINDASVQQGMLEKLIRLSTKYSDTKLFNKLVISMPWRKEIPPMWQHINLPTLSNTMLDVVKEYLETETDEANKITVRRQYFEQSIGILSNANNESDTIVALCFKRLVDDPNNFGVADFVTELTFSEIFVGLLNLNASPSDKIKSELLLKALDKRHVMWEKAKKPDKIFNFKKNSRLYKRYGDIVTQIFESWH